MGSRRRTPNSLLVVEPDRSSKETAEPVRSQFPSRTPRKSPRVQASPSSRATVKVLGQDTEVSVDDLWDENGRITPDSRPLSGTSGRFPPRSDSSGSRRTPTPSKQISLTAVKRKEENTGPIEFVDWNDFDRPVSADSVRLPSPSGSFHSQGPYADDEGVDHDVLVRKREQEMTSALQMHSHRDLDSDLAKRLSLDDEYDQSPGLSNVNYNFVNMDKDKKSYTGKQSTYLTEPKPRRERSNHSVDLRTDTYSGSRYDQDFQEPRTSYSAHSFEDQEQAARGSRKLPVPSSSDGVLTVGKGESGTRQGLRNKSNSSYKSATTAKASALPVHSTIAEESESSRQTSAESSRTLKSTTGASKGGNTEEEEEDSDTAEEEEEEDLLGNKGKAPNELLMEFVECMMKQEYETAEKLCKMILIYEPDNEEALTFYPLIQEKIQLDAEEEEEEEGESEDSGEDSDDDDDDEDDDDEDEDDEEDEDEEEDDDDDDDEESSGESDGDFNRGGHPDSGIASANSD